MRHGGENIPAMKRIHAIAFLFTALFFALCAIGQYAQRASVPLSQLGHFDNAALPWLSVVGAVGFVGAAVLVLAGCGGPRGYVKG